MTNSVLEIMVFITLIGEAIYQQSMLVKLYHNLGGNYAM